MSAHAYIEVASRYGPLLPFLTYSCYANNTVALINEASKMKFLTIVLAVMLSISASAGHHENDAIAMNIENAKTFFLLDTDPQVADSLLHEDFEFVFMGRAKISNTVYTKETFRSVFMEQVFGPLVPDGFKKVEILYAFGDEENVAVIAEGDADGINGRYNNNYALILKFKDGKIYRINEYASDLLVETALYKQKLVPIE